MQISTYFPSRRLTRSSNDGNKWANISPTSKSVDWKEAQKHLDTDIWKDILEKNRLIMYEGDSWGVPTFRLVDGDKTFTTWGQDRIWLIEEEIIKRLNK